MEFLVGPSGQVVLDPEKSATDEQIARSQSAMDFFQANAERIRHYKQRVEDLGRTGQDTVITLINVDDPIGRVLADILMPGHDWQTYRDAGEIPVARGLASKSGIPEFLEGVGYGVAASELLGTNDLRVVVLDVDIALVLDVEYES